MPGAGDWIHPFRARRGATLGVLSGITEAQITTRVPEGGEVRGALWRISTLLHQRRVELALTFDALDWHPTEAQRALAIAMEARGELRAILVGLSDDVLDQAPAPGEWSAREALAHLLTVDDRYMQAIVYAVGRARRPVELPLRRPDPTQPPDPPDVAGSLARVWTHLDAMRDTVIASLASIDGSALAAPVPARERQVEVRDRLPLFAAHEREHTGQIARTLRAIGFAQTEAQMILGAAEAARGAIEGMLIGLPSESFDREPGDDRASVQNILTRALDDEARVVDSVAHLS